MDTRNKITFLTAGVFSVFWIYVLPIMNESSNTERNGFRLQNTEGITVVSQLQLYFIFLGIIVLVIQKGSINFLFEYFKKDTQKDTQIDKQIDNTTVILLYILSFFIPLAGFIVGAIYASKDEEHYKHVGKNCLIFSVLNIVLVLFSYILVALILFA